jgi:hypothetical protein
MKWIRDILTADKDSTVFDLVRVAFASAFVVGLALQVYVVVRGEPFDIQAFGTGFGLMIAGAGGAMALRKDREEE